MELVGSCDPNGVAGSVESFFSFATLREQKILFVETIGAGDMALAGAGGSNEFVGRGDSNDFVIDADATVVFVGDGSRKAQLLATGFEDQDGLQPTNEAASEQKAHQAKGYVFGRGAEMFDMGIQLSANGDPGLLCINGPILAPPMRNEVFARAANDPAEVGDKTAIGKFSGEDAAFFT